MEGKLNLLIAGSRNFYNFSEANSIVLKSLCRKNLSNIRIISGGARGADKFAELFAEQYNIELLIYKAEWDKYGRRAGMVRNLDLVKNADIAIIFWDKESSGTLNTISLIKEKGIPYLIIYFDKTTNKIINMEGCERRNEG